MLLFLSIAAFIGEGTQDAMLDQIQEAVGGEAAEAITAVVEDAEEEKAGTVSAIIGVATLIFSASGVFAQLQLTMNKVWNVTPKPEGAVWGWLRKRLLSMGMVLSVAFILLASLVVSAMIGMIVPGTGALWNLVTAAVSMLVFVVLFAMIFKFLPDVQIGWRDVWVGAVLTAVLFASGKYAIGLYIGNSAVASSYGTAGSLIAMLVWVYYSAVIVLFGAELTQVYATRYGFGIRPEAGAVNRDEAEARGEAA